MMRIDRTHFFYLAIKLYRVIKYNNKNIIYSFESAVLCSRDRYRPDAHVRVYFIIYDCVCFRLVG